MNSPSIITKVYDLLKHLILYVIKKIPKDQRFTLGNKIQSNTQEVLEKLIEAYYTTSENKKKILQEVNIKLEILRHYIRLCHDIGFYDSKKYKFLSEAIDEIGREVGGWIKSFKN